jgi:hypothetical protein
VEAGVAVVAAEGVDDHRRQQVRDQPVQPQPRGVRTSDEPAGRDDERSEVEVARGTRVSDPALVMA